MLPIQATLTYLCLLVFCQVPASSKFFVAFFLRAKPGGEMHFTFFFFFLILNSSWKKHVMLPTFSNASFLLEGNTVWTDQCLFTLFNSAMQLVYVLTGYQTWISLHVPCNKKGDFGHFRNEVLPDSLYSPVLFKAECLASNVKIKMLVNIKK